MFEKVLDRGFVKLVDFMGGDYSVVESARVSFGEGTKGPRQDIRLIRYLLKHKHETPFEHSVFKFHVKAPIFVARQWFRHRIGSFNEISLRYVEYKDEFYIPEFMRRQAEKDKQASLLEPVEESDELVEELEEHYRMVKAFYDKLLEKGVARELARTILPMGTYTQFYWSVNARSLMNFVRLRADEHAQWEIQQYANVIARMFRALMPVTFKFFVDFVFDGSSDYIEKLRDEMEEWNLEEIYSQMMKEGSLNYARRRWENGTGREEG